MRSYRKTEISTLSEETVQEGDQLAVQMYPRLNVGPTHHGVVSRGPDGNLVVYDFGKAWKASNFPSLGSVTSVSPSSTGFGEGTNRRVMTLQKWSQKYTVRYAVLWSVSVRHATIQ